MAARATGKPKQASSGRASTKAGTSSPNAARAAKAAAKKSASAKRTGTKSASSKYSDPVSQLLADQNEALRAELEQANARIQELEVLNKNVLNRIDWVIDSLQSVIEAKQ